MIDLGCFLITLSSELQKLFFILGVKKYTLESLARRKG